MLDYKQLSSQDTNDALEKAYQSLSNEDKANIDFAIHFLEYELKKLFPRIQFSRNSALELLFKVGVWKIQNGDRR